MCLPVSLPFARGQDSGPARGARTEPVATNVETIAGVFEAHPDVALGAVSKRSNRWFTGVLVRSS